MLPVARRPVVFHVSSTVHWMGLEEDGAQLGPAVVVAGELPAGRRPRTRRAPSWRGRSRWRSGTAPRPRSRPPPARPGRWGRAGRPGTHRPDRTSASPPRAPGSRRRSWTRRRSSRTSRRRRRGGRAPPPARSATPDPAPGRRCPPARRHAGRRTTAFPRPPRDRAGPAPPCRRGFARWSASRPRIRSSRSRCCILVPHGRPRTGHGSNSPVVALGGVAAGPDQASTGSAPTRVPVPHGAAQVEEGGRVALALERHVAVVDARRRRRRPRAAAWPPGRRRRTWRGRGRR